MLPTNPTKLDEGIAMPLETVALAITGAAFFNAEDAFLNIALPVEGH